MSNAAKSRTSRQSRYAAQRSTPNKWRPAQLRACLASAKQALEIVGVESPETKTPEAQILQRAGFLAYDLLSERPYMYLKELAHKLGISQQQKVLLGCLLRNARHYKEYVAQMQARINAYKNERREAKQ